MGKNFHIAQANSHVAIAKCHKEMAKLHGLIADAQSHKSAQGIRDDCHESISACHEELSGHHADLADQHLKCVKSIDTHDDTSGADVLRIAGVPEKFGMFGLRDSESLDKIVPTNVHGVMPVDVPRLVARHGGPPLDSGESEIDAIEKFSRPASEAQQEILK